MGRIVIMSVMMVLSLNLYSTESKQSNSIQNNKKQFEKVGRFSDENNPEDLFNLGVSYSNGQGVKKDLKKAKELWLKSANMGYARAQYNLGVMYHEGIFVKKNYLKALKWFKMAARQNTVESFYVVGLMYENGEGVKKNIKKALEFYIRAADLGEGRALERIKKDPLLEKDLDIRIRGLDAAKNHNLNLAIKLFKKSLRFRREALGHESYTIAKTYNSIANFYNQMGDSANALIYYQKELAIKENYGKIDNLDLGSSYSIMGFIYSKSGNYAEALKYQKKALNIIKRVFGERHLSTATLYTNIGVANHDMGNYSEALKYYNKALTIRKEILGEKHPDIASSYSYIGDIYSKLGNYTKALKYQKKALTIRKEILGEKHPDIASSYSYIGELYLKMGNYTEALEFQKRVLSILESILGEKHPDTAKNYNNIGAVYRLLGNYSEALKYQKKALAVMKAVFGKQNINTAVIYQGIGLTYLDMGKYSKALKYLNESLFIREVLFGKDNIDTAENYNSIGALYWKMGNYSGALKYMKKTLIIQEEILGKDNPQGAIVYNNIGKIYNEMNNNLRALEYFKKALAVTKSTRGKKNLLRAACHDNIGNLYMDLGNYSEALAHHMNALATREKILGKDNVVTARSYNNIGLLYLVMGNDSKALKYSLKANKIFNQVLGKKHSDTALSYNNIGQLYQTLHNYPQSYHYAQLAFDNFLLNRDDVFTILDSKQKEKYLQSTSGYITLLLDSSYESIGQLNKEGNTTKVQQILQSGANAWLNYKGSIFDSENAIATLYASTKDKKLKQKIEELVSFKRHLAKLYQSLPKPKEMGVWKKHIKETEEKISKLTNEISSKATLFKKEQGLKKIKYTDLTSSLKKEELYIDYARTEEYYYLFTLDHEEHITFTRLDKNSTKETDSLIKSFRKDIDMILKGKDLTDEKLRKLISKSKTKLSRLYELVIKKPLDSIFKNKTSLILSPDGALRLLPFETLYDNKEGKYFIEEKEIRYIPSGKELARLYKYVKETRGKKQSVVIFANPNFDTKLTSLFRKSMVITPNTNPSSIIKPLFSMEFTPLPGTKAEAEVIKRSLNKKDIIEYLQEEATESNLIKVKEPSILHIATHGFFINDKTIPNPMLRSGIALTGANKSRILGKGDGIVTALKLSGLDLKGTDLVVISACETGVVDINSTDNVSGLSKAFIQAGAKDVIMSLWSVDDQATKELMGSFYRQIKRNKNKDYAKALREAKLKMIKEGRHPFYWGAFVVSGE